MATLDGVYHIRSALNDNKPSLVPGPELPIWPPRPVQVLGLEVTGLRLTKYRVTPAGPPGSNLYTITLADRNTSHLLVQDDRLWLFSQSAPTVFSIVPAEGNRKIVGIPSQNKVWNLEEVHDQVKVTGQDGSLGQRWIFEEVQEDN